MFKQIHRNLEEIVIKNLCSGLSSIIKHSSTCRSEKYAKADREKSLIYSSINNPNTVSLVASWLNDHPRLTFKVKRHRPDKTREFNCCFSHHQLQIYSLIFALYMSSGHYKNLRNVPNVHNNGSSSPLLPLLQSSKRLFFYNLFPPTSSKLHKLEMVDRTNLP